MTQHISNQNQNYKYCLVVKTEKPSLRGLRDVICNSILEIYFIFFQI